MKFFPGKYLWLAFIFILQSLVCRAQTQEDFQTKMSEVYAAGADKKKALAAAKELFAMAERKKDLQTYSNYYLLKTIFENQAPDAALAKTCGEKAEKLMNAMVGLNTEMKPDTSNPSMAWSTYYFPRLFKNDDPAIASKARAFLDRNPDLKNFNNFTYLGYAFERVNDFAKAKQNYEEALKYVTDEKNEYHPYLFYTNFLTRSGDYLKADEYIARMERLSEQATDFFKTGYKAEALSARVVYYLNIGDYQSYVTASEKNYQFSSATWHASNTTPCDPYPGIRLVNAAFAKEMMREYDAAEKLWKSRDSANYVWVNCYNKTYPNARYYPLSIYPVYLLKRGKRSALPRPVSYFIKETEDHYNSYSNYADISAQYMKAQQLGFLGSSSYPSLFKTVMETVKKSRDFRESTTPFANYAYFAMRDRDYTASRDTYLEMFTLNGSWINDIIFTFGEKAFVTYYNARLREGYDNFHSFVKIAKEKQPALFPQLSGQAFSNLLFTKSISLRGTEKRKEAFLNSNDPAIDRLYGQWVERKQQLLRLYMKTSDPATVDTSSNTSQADLKKMQDEVNRLENELTIKSKDFKKYLQLTLPDWKTVRDQLKDGEAAVEMARFQWRDQVYYSDTSYYAAYIITKNSAYPEVVYLPDGAADLDNKYFKGYKNSIRLKLDDKESYNRFWKPVAEQLKGIRKIFFSPDGIYHLINISTLKNPASGKFLLDELEVQYTTAATGINKSNTIAPATASLFGRPSYKTGATPATPVAEGTTRSLVRSFRENSIADLPGTEEEVMVIKKEIDQNRVGVTTFLKEQATEDKMYKLKSPGILHIATHGYWSPAGDNATEGYRTFNAMVNSGLLLSGVVNYYSAPVYPDTYDGILTAYEAQNLNLENTALVILSACETSLGYLDAGEGVYGLQRAFRTAGAGSIMTSLWKVDDVATRDFMISFYQHYLKTRNTNAAYTEAQKATRDKYAHPYFWGAFIMTGN